MSATALRADVAIVGAGIAGAALAALLAAQDLNVLLLEGNELTGTMPVLPTDIAGVDPRVSALNVVSRGVLEDAGAWSALPDPVRGGYNAMRVWEEDGTGRISFDAADIGAPVLGFIVENRWITACLLGALALQPRVQLRSGERLASLRLPAAPGQQVELSLASGLTVRANLLVGADGAQSAVRTLCGIEAPARDSGQRAIVATIRTSGSHQNTAWQRFLQSGPLALLPLAALEGGHASSIVWSADIPVAERLLSLDDAAFMAQLTRASEACCGEVLEVTPRLSFPLRQLHAPSYTAPGMVLVGDAAHVIHPLAGQGINLGLADVRVLAQEIARARGRGQSVASADALARYARRRRGENATMLAAMQGFQRLFGDTHPAVRLVRNLGLGAVDRLVPIKRAFMREAMGL